MSSRRRPTSLRAVTNASSKRGWVWRIRAASAPANPAAPNTAALAGTDPAPQLIGERLADLCPLGCYLVVGERSIARPIAQPQSQRYVSLSKPLGGPVDV